MPEPFIRLDSRQFLDLVARFPFRRRIGSVHMHHTWKPRRRDFRGLETILAMRDFHVQTNGWSDIAQHVTIDPEGRIWTGRDWNKSPASSTGFNGNAVQGPFMFEMIGNFDRGEDPFDGPQREAAVQVIAAVQLRFGLSAASLRFHREMSRKTCPGTGIDYDEVLRQVAEAQLKLREGTRSVADAWATPSALAFREPVDRVILAASGPAGALGRSAENGAAPEEPAEEEMGLEQQLAALGDHDSARSLAARGSRAPRDADLTPPLLDALRPYVVNLRQGRLSAGGKVSTSVRDLDTMFGELDRWVAGATDAPRRIVLYAHGGLVSEGDGLRVALDHVDWWRANDVYPIYFVWETGFVETLAQMLVAGAERERVVTGARDLTDVSDWLIEKTSRLAGPGIWGTMKRSAERAFDEEGDQRGAETNGRAVIRRLIALCGRHPGKVELHGVGHSAGSIFQTYLLGAYEAMRGRAAAAERPHLPRFSSLQLLAPAVTADLYLRRLHPLIGGTVDQLRIFTMERRRELDDNCIGIYRKSLLYLIYHSLEDRSDTDVLGLQECLQARELKEALDANETDVIYSSTQLGSEQGRRASGAVHHGSFDEDPWTMNSVLCGVVDRDPHQLKRAYPVSRRRAPVGDALSDRSQWRTIVSTVQEPTPVPPIAAETPVAYRPSSPSSLEIGSGRRRALCVGIDQYPTAPLGGCVNDARSWAGVLRDGFGFEPPMMLLDDEATRARILSELTALIQSAKSGDVLAFAYAGHGTELPDLGGDESEGNNGPMDEALCPVDFAEGAFVIDDDLRDVLAQVPGGVSLTCFFDCCHSGNATRLAAGPGPIILSAPSDRRPRYVRANRKLIEAHRRFRTGEARGATTIQALSEGRREDMRHVLFSACKDFEVAYEEGGAGAFTGYATGVLRSAAESLTNAQFQERVTSAFGSAPQQHPELDCAPGWEGYHLFQGVATADASRGRFEGGLPGRAVVHEALESLLGGNGQS